MAASYGDSMVKLVSDTIRGWDATTITERLENDSRVTIHYGTTVTALHGEGHLEAVTMSGAEGERRIETRALFIMIGAAPNTDWLSDLVETDKGGFILTGAEVDRPSPFETSCDGVFAVGDVRSGSVKRVASAVGEGSVVVSRIWSYVDTLETGGQDI